MGVYVATDDTTPKIHPMSLFISIAFRHFELIQKLSVLKLKKNSFGKLTKYVLFNNIKV